MEKIQTILKAIWKVVQIVFLFKSAKEKVDSGETTKEEVKSEVKSELADIILSSSKEENGGTSETTEDK